jgi:hypothetical protein
VRTAHGWRQSESCTPRAHPVTPVRRVAHGARPMLHGILATDQGAPIGGAPVAILTRPAVGGSRFTTAETVTTDAGGQWSAKLPAGPSRLIEAHYAGAATIEPATSHAELDVHARIELSITPARSSWHGTLHVTGHLVGGHVPRSGVQLVLQVRYGGRRRWSTLEPVHTDGRGRFAATWSYHQGRGRARYPFRISFGAQAGYPYIAGASAPVLVRFHP